MAPSSASLPFIKSSIRSLTSDIGIAKPIPSTLADVLVAPLEYLSEFIPTTSPLALSSAPPLLPPFIAASI